MRLREFVALLAAGVFVRATFCPVRHIHSTAPTTGFIESPGYPGPYGAGLDCVFNLTTASSNVLQLAFVAFDVAGRNVFSGQCLDAYIVIIVVDRQGRHHVGERLCGNVLPRPIYTMQSWLMVQFVTTSSAGGNKGFRMQYRMLSEGAIREPDSSLGEPFSGCGGHSVPGQRSGVIVSPGYPTTYPKNSTCNWLIRVEARQRIYIRIVHLHLASNLAECDRATLTIMDGYKHESGNERKDAPAEAWEARFCGTQSYYSEEGMKSYLSSANRILVRMATRDGPGDSMLRTDERIGFKIVWTAVEGLIDANPPPGVVESLKDDDSACKDQFICHGGQVCVEQGHGICASRSRLCIHSSLVCDGVHNCVEGDFSDEQHCYSKEIVTSAAIGFSAIIVAMLVLVCCDQWRKKRRLQQMIRERRAAANGKCGDASSLSFTVPVRLPPNR